MNGIIQMLVEYFRNLSNLHPEVNGFMTGEKYDSNLNWQEYPVVFLRYPMTGTIEEDYVYVNLELSCYTNTLKDENGTELVQGENTTERPTNQVDYLNLLPSDAMMERCLHIMGNYIVKLKQDCDSVSIPARFIDSKYVTKSRVFNDSVTGVEVTIRLKFDNPYKCEVPEIFTL